MKKFLALALAALLCACSTAPVRTSAQSWDQENLKRYDIGCPTAIFIAPGGDLVQCEFENVSDAKDEPKFFPTADAAALYVVAKIYERNHYYEYGGVIGKGPKGYAISLPLTQRHGTNVEFSEDPEDYNLPIVATYHVHPCLSGVFPSVFSPQDLAGARTAKTPAYMLDECTGLLHYWAPGDGYMSLDDLLALGVDPSALAHGVRLSAGKIVGKIVVDGVVLH